jgi:hypothetical protein
MLVDAQDVTLDMGDLDPEETLYAPLKKVLDQCRSGKNPSKYVISLDWDSESHSFVAGN